MTINQLKHLLSHYPAGMEVKIEIKGKEVEFSPEQIVSVEAEKEEDEYLVIKTK